MSLQASVLLPAYDSPQAETSLHFDLAEVKQLARTDLSLFAGIMNPEVVLEPFPALYCELWGKLTSGAISLTKLLRLALALPRGHAKTTFIRLFIAWIFLYSTKRYVILFSASTALAKAAISDVFNMLSSPNCIAIYGDWREHGVETDTQDFKKFSTSVDVQLPDGTVTSKLIPRVFRALGAGSAIRGTNENSSRPDVILFDDAQTKENAESVVDSAKFQAWFVATALKIRSKKNCLIVYIGNMYRDIKLPDGRYCCQLRNLQFSTKWLTTIVGAILANGEVLWEAIATLEDLRDEYEHDKELGQEATFMAEVQNDPSAVTNQSLNLSLLSPYQPYPGELPLGSFIVIDPATSKATPDQIVIAYFQVYSPNVPVPVCTSLDASKYTSQQTCYAAIELALSTGCPLIFVEANAYQYELCTWIEFICRQMNIRSIKVVPITNSKQKNSRILQFFLAWQKQEVLTSQATHNLVLTQALNFNSAKTDNLDDILDSMEMGHRIYATYSEEIHALHSLTSHERHFDSPRLLNQIYQHTSF